MMEKDVSLIVSASEDATSDAQAESRLLRRKLTELESSMAGSAVAEPGLYALQDGLSNAELMLSNTELMLTNAELHKQLSAVCNSPTSSLDRLTKEQLPVELPAEDRVANAHGSTHAAEADTTE